MICCENIIDVALLLTRRYKIEVVWLVIELKILFHIYTII